MKQKVLFLQKKVLFLYKKVLWYKWKCFDIKQVSLLFSKESNKVPNGVPQCSIHGESKMEKQDLQARESRWQNSNSTTR